MSHNHKTLPFAISACWMLGVVGAVAFLPGLAGRGHFDWLVAHGAWLFGIGLCAMSAAVVVAIFCENFTNRTSPTAVVAAIGCMALFVFICFGGGEVNRAIYQLSMADKVAAEAAQNVGAGAVPTVVEKRLQRDRTSWAAYVRDEAFVKNVAAAATLRAKILAWLAGAHEFGVDGKSVAVNGMITPADDARLFRKAMQMSATGDRMAIAWVAQHPTTE